MVDELRQDLRYALRSLRSAPGFATVALLTLAIGIGANAAVFSVIRGVLLEPLPFANADRIVRVWSAYPAQGIARGALSEPDFLDWRRSSRLTETMGGYFFADGITGVNLTGNGDPEYLSAALVTDGFFETLRTPALIGRPLLAEEHQPGRNRVVVLSHGFWTRRFGGDRTLVGRSVTLDGNPYVVVGVMPPGFTYPAANSIDAWLSLSDWGPEIIGRCRGCGLLQVIARMKPGVTAEQLRVELSDIAKRLSREYPDNPGLTEASVTGIQESIVGDVRRPLVVLMAAVAILLLIACVNIASLLLARAAGRQRELAVRAALGAGRGRITRQLLTESLTLALLGGVLGVALAIVAVRALTVAGGGELPRMDSIRIDGLVLAFIVGVSVLAGVAFGVLPAVRAASRDLERSLRAGARGSVGGVGQRLRSALVVAEVALAVILVVGAGLATKSFARLIAVNPGFTAENALVVEISIPGKYFSSYAALSGYYQGVLDAIGNLRGVQAVGSIRDLPLRGNGEMMRFDIPGRVARAEKSPTAQWHHISAGYFRAMGIPLRAGRDFELDDRAGRPPVIVVNEEFVRRYWPGEDAIGKTIRVGTTDFTVVGVVGDVRQRGLPEGFDPAVYVHALQNMRARMSIVVRTNREPRQFATAVRTAIWSVEPNQTVRSVTTVDEVLGRAVARPRLLAWLLAVFGAVALTLGALGIFGVLAHAVNQRRQEIGVRVALGASPRNVMQLIIGRGMLLAGVGAAVGVIGAWFLTRSMQSVLYEVEATDPLTFAAVVVILLTSALLASCLPAWRAVRIDPVNALRYD